MENAFFFLLTGRFRNQLIRGSWYPIEKISNEEHGFFNLVGYKKSHFSLFDQIVALPNHEDKFEDLKLTHPKVKKYWSDKLKRIKNKIESFDFSSDKDLKLLEREERFSEGKASIFDILSKKTEEMSNKVFKTKKRKI